MDEKKDGFEPIPKAVGEDEGQSSAEYEEDPFAEDKEKSNGKDKQPIAEGAAQSDGEAEAEPIAEDKGQTFEDKAESESRSDQEDKVRQVGEEKAGPISKSGAHSDREHKIRPNDEDKVEPIEESRERLVPKDEVQPGEVKAQSIAKSAARSVHEDKVQPIGEDEAPPMGESGTPYEREDEVQLMGEDKAKHIAKSGTRSAQKDEVQPVSKAKSQPLSKAKSQALSKAKSQPLSKAKSQALSKAKSQPLSKAKAQPMAKSGARSNGEDEARSKYQPRQQQNPVHIWYGMLAIVAVCLLMYIMWDFEQMHEIRYRTAQEKLEKAINQFPKTPHQYNIRQVETYYQQFWRRFNFRNISLTVASVVTSLALAHWHRQKRVEFQARKTLAFWAGTMLAGTLATVWGLYMMKQAEMRKLSLKRLKSNPLLRTSVYLAMIIIAGVMLFCYRRQFQEKKSGKHHHHHGHRHPKSKKQYQSIL